MTVFHIFAAYCEVVGGLWRALRRRAATDLARPARSHRRLPGPAAVQARPLHRPLDLQRYVAAELRARGGGAPATRVWFAARQNGGRRLLNRYGVWLMNNPRRPLIQRP